MNMHFVLRIFAGANGRCDDCLPARLEDALDFIKHPVGMLNVFNHICQNNEIKMTLG